MTRKEFLALLAAGSASRAFAEPPTASAAPARATPAPAKQAAPPLKLPAVQAGPPYLLAGPMLGHVGTSEARLWIRATAPVAWSVRIAESASLEGAREIAGPALADDSAATGVVVIDGLKPATRYFYQVLVEGRPQTVAPLPTFVTAPESGVKGRQRIAFGCCVGETLAAAAPAWAELAVRREMDAKAGGFDVFLMLGDNHYANSTEIAKLRTYYTAHRLTAGWRDLSARTPIYAIWDDHDFGPDNSDGTQKGKEDSLRVFREFWANPACGEPENPGCYFTFQRGDVQVFMLDGRYHRSPDKAPDGPEKTMFGELQLAWLKRELLASKAAVKLLANGSEWQTHGSDDSYSLYRRERDAFFAWIDEQKIEGVILLSGDRHFSSGYHVLGRFVELSSSPLGSSNARLRPNPERFTGYDEGSLWMILDIDTTAAEPAVAYELWLAGGGLLERRAFTWAQLHGREPIALSPSPLQPPRWPARPAAKPV
jgi:alkaline phosphatase D